MEGENSPEWLGFKAECDRGTYRREMLGFWAFAVVGRDARVL